MGMEARTVAAGVHGTYLVTAPANGASTPVASVPIVVGFHGYGENAARHLAELERIPGAGGWRLCSVQALHPFYTRTNEVVASCRTRHDREHAIADNVGYVTAVLEELARGGALGPLFFAGFSQGVAMAYRAAAGCGRPSAGVLSLGGDVPPDLERADLSSFPPVLVGRGRNDLWYDQAKMDRDLAFLTGRGVAVHPHVFAGGHEWTDDFRRAAAEFIGSRLGR